jgi:hypothetical protein
LTAKAVIKPAGQICGGGFSRSVEGTMVSQLAICSRNRQSQRGFYERAKSSKAARETLSVLLDGGSMAHPRTKPTGAALGEQAALVWEIGVIFHYLQKITIFERFFRLKLKQIRYSTPYI